MTIIDVIYAKEYTSKNKILYPNFVFILAGGIGKRLLPHTKFKPKPL